MTALTFEDAVAAPEPPQVEEAAGIVLEGDETSQDTQAAETTSTAPGEGTVQVEEAGDASLEDSPAAPSTALPLPRLWVAGNLVTSANQTNILGDGTCSLAYDENAGRWMLTLRNANVSVAGATQGILVESGDIELAINLAGTNSITTENGAGIQVQSSDLSISGTGTLAVTSSGGKAIYSTRKFSSSGPATRGNISITGVKTLNLNGKGGTLNCGGSLTAKNSTIRATDAEVGMGSAAVQVFYSCTIDASVLFVSASGTDSYGMRCGMQGTDPVRIVNGSSVSIEAVRTGLYAAGFNRVSLEVVDSTLSSETSDTQPSGNGAVFAEGDISLSGSQTVAEVKAVKGSGFHAIGSISFSGGKIKAQSKDASAVYAGKTITVSGAQADVTATGGSFGLSASSGISLLGGTVRAYADAGSASWGIMVGNGPLTIDAANGAKIVSWAKNAMDPSESYALYGKPIGIIGDVDVVEGVDAGTAKPVSDLSVDSLGDASYTPNAYVSIVPAGGSIPKPAPQLSRLAGTDRYLTMAGISKAAFPYAGSCSTVVVARGDNFPDALAAAGLAGITGGQVLLTETSRLTSATSGEIKRLGAKKAYVIGDKHSVSDSAFNSIKSLVGGNAERLGGAGREDTAVKIYEAGKKAGGWGTTAIVTTGQKAPDSLSVSPVAYALKAPIFLADQNGSLSQTALNAIKAGGFTRVIVLGDKYSVSNTAFSKVKTLVPDTSRMGGTDRYATSKLTAKWALENGFTCKSATFTAGRNGKFADALVASSLAGKSKSVLLLVDDGVGNGSACVDDVLASNKDQAETVYVLGDKYTVSDAMYRRIEKILF